jgi:hypothetical protein
MGAALAVAVGMAVGGLFGRRPSFPFHDDAPRFSLSERRRTPDVKYGSAFSGEKEL